MMTFNDIISITVYDQSNQHFKERNLNILKSAFEIDANGTKTDFFPFDLGIIIIGMNCDKMSFKAAVDKQVLGPLDCTSDNGFARHTIPVDNQDNAYDTFLSSTLSQLSLSSDVDPLKIPASGY